MVTSFRLTILRTGFLISAGSGGDGGKGPAGEVAVSGLHAMSFPSGDKKLADRPIFSLIVIYLCWRPLPQFEQAILRVRAKDGRLRWSMAPLEFGTLRSCRQYIRRLRNVAHATPVQQPYSDMVPVNIWLLGTQFTSSGDQWADFRTVRSPREAHPGVRGSRRHKAQPPAST